MENNQTGDVASKASSSRIVAISYRDKEILRDGVVIEQRPTMAYILDGGTVTEVSLLDEDYEMCFVASLSITLPPTKVGGKSKVIDFTSNGIRKGDTMLMVMGGSAAFFAFSLSNRLEKLGDGGVYWVGSTVFKRLCEEHSLERSKMKDVDDQGRRTEKTFDHIALPKLFELVPHLFHRVSVRERDLILLQDVTSRRKESMNARMACAARVRQRMQQLAYCKDDGYPEGGIKMMIEQGVANDAMLQLFIKEETKIGAELKKLLRSLPVWKVFEPIEGVGEFTAAPLIVAIGDIYRFPSASNLKAFLGVHTLTVEGKKFTKGEHPEAGKTLFARRRQGQLSNWNQEGRQSLYLIADQFMLWRRNSPWGLVASVVKKRFQAKYPNPQVWRKKWVNKDNLSTETVASSAGSGQWKEISPTEKHYVTPVGDKHIFTLETEKFDLYDGKCKRIPGGWEITDDTGVLFVVKGVTKFNPAHINRMTAWRTMTKFVEWLYKAWIATEEGKELPHLPYRDDVNALLLSLEEDKGKKVA